MSTRFTALTVREGDAFLLEDYGWKCLFDSGKDKTIVDLLKYKGIDKLDLAICSHNDSDHANGFIELLKSDIKIKEIWLPGLLASVLLFVKENCNMSVDEKWGDENHYGNIDSLFSDESVSCDTFMSDLSNWVEKSKSDCSHFIHQKISHRISENPDIIADIIYQDIQLHFNEKNDCIYTKEQLRDYFDDYFDDYWEVYFPRIPFRVYRDLAYEIFINRLSLSEFKKAYMDFYSDKDIFKRTWYIIDFKLNKIINIAKLALRNGCNIRWFEPSTACSKNKIDYEFVSLNSGEIGRIKKLKNCLAFLHALFLTKENKHSLVFEYTKNDIPIIRFSADSDCTCQSVTYSENILVTAPHHGSGTNAHVYKSIQGDNIIWVRSDKMSKYNKRPCQEFKDRTNKYCLACHRFNFISEICFEYNTCLKQWDYISGQRCRCK